MGSVSLALESLLAVILTSALLLTHSALLATFEQDDNVDGEAASLNYTFDIFCEHGPCNHIKPT